MFRHLFSYLSDQWVWLNVTVWLLSFHPNQEKKSFMFCSSWELTISIQLLHKICRGKFAAQKFFGQVWGILGKISFASPTICLHPQKFTYGLKTFSVVYFCWTNSGAFGLTPRWHSVFIHCAKYFFSQVARAVEFPLYPIHLRK